MPVEFRFQVGSEGDIVKDFERISHNGLLLLTSICPILIHRGPHQMPPALQCDKKFEMQTSGRHAVVQKYRPNVAVEVSVVSSS